MKHLSFWLISWLSAVSSARSAMAGEACWRGLLLYQTGVRLVFDNGREVSLAVAAPAGQQLDEFLVCPQSVFNLSERARHEALGQAILGGILAQPARR
jgi:hypothetical protein